ncbi:MAG: sodium:alanine symporter family protein, partial [Alteromonadaceae bacterium]
MINEIVNAINNVLWGQGQILIYLLVFAGCWFTYRLRFIQLFHFKYMFTVMKGGTKSNKSGISSFQALCT